MTCIYVYTCMHINNSACTTKKQNSSLHMCMPSCLARQVHNICTACKFIFKVRGVCLFLCPMRSSFSTKIIHICMPGSHFNVQSQRGRVDMEVPICSAHGCRDQETYRFKYAKGNILTAYKKSKTRQFLGATYN